MTLALGCETENDVIQELQSIALELGFDDCRYYDVNHCPFRGRWFATLRSWRHASASDIGMEVVDTTFDNAIATPNRAFFETALGNKALDVRKHPWIERLRLWKSGWYDVPVLDGDEIIGLWAVSRKGLRKATSGLANQLFDIGTVAGARIAHLRDRHARESVLTLLPLDDTGGMEGLVRNGLERIARALDAAFVAFYSFDPRNERLVRVLEIAYERDTGRYQSFLSKADESYAVGQFLTGLAFIDRRIHYIPSFEGYRSHDGRHINQGSVTAHETHHNVRLTSLLFSSPHSATGVTGLIRVINRASIPALPFTKDHAQLLKELSYPVFDAIASVQTSERFELLWRGFQQVYSHVRDTGLAFRDLNSIAEPLHVRETVVSVWSTKGELVEAWRWVSGASSRPVSTVGIADEPFDAPEGLVAASTLHKRVQRLLPPDADLILAVPYREARAESEHAPLVLTLFVLSARTGESENTSERLRKYWLGDAHARKTLELIGRMLGVVHELSRNRSLLRLAEEAIGTIGHEARSPLSELIGLHSDLFDLFDAVANSSEQTKPIKASVVSVARNANTLVQIDSKQSAMDWLSAAQARLAESTRRIGRVVSDAIRWARLGGESIEAHFEPVVVADLVAQALRELRTELNSRPWLRVVVSPSVDKAREFIGDPVLLQVLFTNLLDNAIKYSHKRDPKQRREIQSHVTVFVETQKNLIDIGFTNWGLGIDPTDYDNIFSSFYRSATRDMAHTIRGVGLGLPTCRRIALVHQGTIRVQSRPTLDDPTKRARMLGYETTFTVRIPFGLPRGRHDINVTARAEHLRSVR